MNANHLSAPPDHERQRSYNGDMMIVGKEGERIVMDWLQRHPYVLGKTVTDLRDLRPMREADVDCSFQLIDGRIVLAEIKTDSHLGQTPNILFEALRINHSAPPDRTVTLGWSARSPAKWLLYYAPAVSRIYQCTFDDFRRAFAAHSHHARKQTRIDFICTDNIKSTVNFLLPLSACVMDGKPIFTIHQL